MTTRLERINRVSERAHGLADRLGGGLVTGFHLLALFAIGGTVVWAAVFAFFDMAQRGHATVEDILLLFIYLELGAMVGIYFTTNHMPVRFLLYVALTALTRLLIGVVNLEHNDIVQPSHVPNLDLLVVSGGILLVSLAVLVIRYASYRYPSLATPVRADRAPEADGTA